MKKLILVLLTTGMFSNLLAQCTISCLNWSNEEFEGKINKSPHSMSLDEIKQFCKNKGFKTYSLFNNTCLSN